MSDLSDYKHGDYVLFPLGLIKCWRDNISYIDEPLLHVQKA